MIAQNVAPISALPLFNQLRVEALQCIYNTYLKKATNLSTLGPNTGSIGQAKTKKLC